MNQLPMHKDAPPIEEGPSLADLFAPPKPKTAPGAGVAGGGEDPEMRAKVAKVIDELRPYINADGGDITLVSVIDGVVKVTMHGACVGCSSSLYTLQLGIERKLKEEIPGIKYIEAI
jgi:lysyl-tRNA synthetase class 2